MELNIVDREIDGIEVNSVNARDVWKELEVKKDFSNWIKQQLKEFTEGTEYLKVALKGEQKIEYILTIETAKSVAMLSRTKKGKEVRNYFIECERVAVSALQIPEYARQLLPDANNYGVANKKGNVRTKAVKGYFKADTQSKLGKLEQQRFKLQQLLGGLIDEDVVSDLRAVETKIRKQIRKI